MGTEKDIVSDISSEGQSFFQHVFNFDKDTQNELSNILQYVLLAVIPVVALNKSIQAYVPEADDSKGNLPILAEIILQLFVIFLGMFFIDRIITFIPTFSKTSYKEINLLNIVLQFLVIVLSLQTKLGEKVNILIERILDAWEGETPQNIKKKQGYANQTQVNVTQPGISPGRDQLLPSQPQAPPSQLGGGGPDFNSMYQGPQNPLQNAATPGQMPVAEGFDMMEPMAANGVLGGGFGSAF